MVSVISGTIYKLVGTFFQNNLKLYIYEMSKENSLNLDSLSDWRIGLDKLKDSDFKFSTIFRKFWKK